MSEDSNFDKGSTKKPKSRPQGGNSDYKQQPKKGNDKNYKEQQPSTGKTDQPLSNQDNYANKGHRNDNYNNAYNKQKSYPRSRRESKDYAPHAWKRKHAKVPKEFILEAYHIAPPSKEMEELAKTVGQLFKKERLLPVNLEPFTLDPNDGLVPKAPPAHAPAGGANQHSQHNQASTAHSSTTTTTNTSMTNLPTAHVNANAVHKAAEKTTTPPVNTTQTQPAEMFDFPSDDPILAMRQKMKRDSADATKTVKANEAAKPKETETTEAQNGSAKIPGSNKENSPIIKAQQEDNNNKDDDKYSDIDEKFEKKLQNNEVEENREDVFDELYDSEQLKSGLEKLSNDQRPEWEDSETVSKDDFISRLPQDKKAIFGDRYVENQRNSETSDGRGNQMTRSGTKESSADFSKVSFDNEQRGSYTEQFGQGEYYEAGNQQKGYPQGGNANYYDQNMGGQNPYQQKPQQQYQNYAGQQQQQKPAYNPAQQQVQAQPQPQPQLGASAGAGASTPSFVFKYFSPDYDAKLWSYIDLEQRVQGPYSGRTMDEWYSKAYLPITLHVTIGKNNGYRTIKELAEVINNHNAGQSPSNKEPPQQQLQQQRPSSQTEIPYQQAKPYQQSQQQYPPQQYGGQQQQHQQQQQYSYQQQQQQSQGSNQTHIINEIIKQHPELLQQYGGNVQALVAKLKTMDLSAYENQYGGQQQQQQTSYQSQQYPTQGQVQGQQQPGFGYGKAQTVMETPTITYFGQDNQKTPTNYNPYAKTSPNQSFTYLEQQQQQPVVNPYNKQQQQQAYGQQTGYNQGAYNQSQPQPQKQQYNVGNKVAYQGQMQGQGGYGQAQGPQYGGAGQGGSQTYIGQGSNMYGMQQQQQQRSPGLGMSPNVHSNEMTSQLKNMLGVQRPSSRQGDPDYQ